MRTAFNSSSFLLMCICVCVCVYIVYYYNTGIYVRRRRSKRGPFIQLYFIISFHYLFVFFLFFFFLIIFIIFPVVIITTLICIWHILYTFILSADTAVVVVHTYMTRRCSLRKERSSVHTHAYTRTHTHTYTYTKRITFLEIKNWKPLIIIMIIKKAIYRRCRDVCIHSRSRLYMYYIRKKIVRLICVCRSVALA